MLTDKKRKEVKELFESVNISSICKDLNVSRVTVWRIINGRSKRVKRMADLKKVIARAKADKAEMEAQSHNL